MGYYPRIFVLSGVLGLMGGCLAQTERQVNVNWQADQEQIKSLAVLVFDWTPPKVKSPPRVSSAHLAEAGAVFADWVTSELMGLNRYSIRERAEIRKVVAEHDLQLADLVAKGDYRRIGKLSGVDALVVGTVAAANVVVSRPVANVQASFTCRCVSTRTGDVMWSMGGDKSVTLTTGLSHWGRILVKELVRELNRKLAHPPADRPAKKPP